MARVLAVGTEEAVAALVERTRRAPHNGWRVDGVCTPTGAGPDGRPTIKDVPVVGDLDTVAALALNGRYDAVSVGQAPGWSPRCRNAVAPRRRRTFVARRLREPTRLQASWGRAARLRLCQVTRTELSSIAVTRRFVGALGFATAAGAAMESRTSAAASLTGCRPAPL